MCTECLTLSNFKWLGRFLRLDAQINQNPNGVYRQPLQSELTVIQASPTYCMTPGAKHKQPSTPRVWAFWFPLPGRCNWWRWMIWEIQAPELSPLLSEVWATKTQKWVICLAADSLLIQFETVCACFFISSGVGLLIFINTLLRSHRNIHPLRLCAVSVFMWGNIFSGSYNSSCRRQKHVAQWHFSRRTYLGAQRIWQLHKNTCLTQLLKDKIWTELFQAY